MLRDRDTLRALLRSPVLLLWALFISLIPFYVFRSGLPQPGDAIVVVLVPAALSGWNGRLGGRSMRVFRALMWFTFWVTIVDLTWCLLLGEWGLEAVFPVYYIYNAGVFLSALVLYQRFGDTFVRVTLNAVFFTVLLQCALSVLVRHSGARSALFFHNPNQLGYYTLLAACIICVAYKRVSFGVLRTTIGLSACGYLALLSASRSAASGIALLVVFLMFSSPRVIVTASIAAFILILAGSGGGEYFEPLQERITMNRNPNLSFFQERGYDRILNNKEYLVAGAGEGHLSRWATTSAIGSLEMHSSAGTILFSYGFVGVMLFGTFLMRLVRGVSIRRALILAPALIYTIAHQGLRFTMLWLFLALYLALLETPAATVARKPAHRVRPLEPASSS